ncbi:C2H2 zinc finger protein [Emericellopsis cladophorae]|uniref:C2H2 zinc finger protein n=1 Tax=Emericellopsis cladophorae TaxID=2686198 RepID=A0A9Q0BBX9_9HYPO|nr:C2H2 zinc finger protein [Emericellopsis cladophorae]KAI6778985.1 C2H2 zinc finger protein [Emericellopsis cladophorae]
MGNSSAKESGASDSPYGAARRRSVAEPSSQAIENDRNARNRVSRGDLSFLGLASASSGRDTRNREDAPFQHKETKAEREARKLEQERAARAKERERSVREEHVDGGFLVTMGVYTGTEDFSKSTVRQLQIERKIAPFWRGLQDWSDSWAEHQIIAAARGLDVPAADETPDPDLVPRPPRLQSDSNQSLQNLTVPMGPRTLSAASDRSGTGAATPAGGQSKSAAFKPGGRAKAIAAALTGHSRNASSTDLGPREIKLPDDPFVNGQALEVFLYKDASECPICFLTYPPYLNKTRCCDQPICSECFVQIKRADPHLPEHHPNGEVRDPNEGLSASDPPEMLISEPANCPYCQQNEFGVTYDPPPFRRGIVYSGSTSNLGAGTAMSSQSSLHATLPASGGSQPGRRRATSLSANAPNVITTDRVRPDWATKLNAARAHQARRAAAATALHTAAFLVGGENEQRGSSLLRPGRFSRRNTGRGMAASVEADTTAEGADNQPEGEARAQGPPGRRRTRMEELEDMMFMEAVRLSLASEEDRRRKEEKAYRKDAKKREKEREKEERKAAKKQAASPYGGSGSGGASGSSLSLGGFGRRRGNSAASNLRMDATVQGAASKSGESSPSANVFRDKTASKEDVTGEDKGKGIDRSLSDSSNADDGAFPGSLPIPTSRGGSHLRQMSNASSVGSSLIDTPTGSYTGTGTEGHDPRASGMSVNQNEDTDGTEPMFNFRSLAEIVGVNIDDGQMRRDDGADSPGKGHPTTGRPLSQVDEDEEKEEAAAEHAEHADVRQLPAPNAAMSADAEKLKGTSSPDLVITPGTPTAESSAEHGKQLGHSNLTGQPPQTTI